MVNYFSWALKPSDYSLAIMEREGTVVCLLCRGMISFKAGDKARFESHLQHEHEAYFGLDVLLAVSFIREEERRALVRSVASGYVYRAERTDLREALDKLRPRARDVTREASDVSSDYSIEDNDKIYGIPEPILKCEKCSRTFINRISLRRHETQHIEQNYSCNECGERFSFLEDLKMHRLSHRDDADMYVYKEEDDTKVDTTNTGDSTRSNDSALTGEAGYVRCKLCLRVLRRDNYLAHKLMHKEEKKTSCLVCDSKFRSHEQLKRHVQKVHRNMSNATLRSRRMNKSENNLIQQSKSHIDDYKQHFPNSQNHENKMEKLDETHYLPMK